MIQIYRGEIDSWHNTAWGGDDLEKVTKTATEIMESNRMGITKVRVVEVLFTLG